MKELNKRIVILESNLKKEQIKNKKKIFFKLFFLLIVMFSFGMFSNVQAATVDVYYLRIAGKSFASQASGSVEVTAGTAVSISTTMEYGSTTICVNGSAIASRKPLWSGTYTFSAGTHTVSLQYSSGGTVTVQTITVYAINPDSTPPTYSNYTVSKTYTNNNQENILVSVAVSDSSGISSVTLHSWTGGSYSSYYTSKTATYNSATGKYEAYFTLAEVKNTVSGSTNQGEGAYTFDGRATDTAGNGCWIGSATVYYDTTVPTAYGTMIPKRYRNSLFANNGTMMYQDPTFVNGVNGTSVYNNLANGTVSVNRISLSDSPDGTYGLQIQTTGEASPGHGGFFFGHASGSNKVFAARIVAKIPVGKTINFAANAYGDGASAIWLTSQNGTGEYEEYVCLITCGNTGNFHTISYFFLYGGEVATTSAPITWYVSYATVFDITSNMLYTDPTFASGTNGTSLYNNLGNGTVSVSRAAVNSAYGTYGLQIQSTGEALPGYGGFFFANTTSADKRYLTRIVAKIPYGYSIAWASNAYGDGGSCTWLTGQAGTGEWTEYICVVQCGKTGTFSSTNFFFLEGGTAPTTSSPLTWYVGYATVFDITNAQTARIAVTASDDRGISYVDINSWTGGSWTTTHSTQRATYNSVTNMYEVVYSFADIKNTVSGATNNGDGEYTFDARAYDLAGNVTYTYAGKLAFDTTPPTISSYTANSITNQDTVTATVVASDSYTGMESAAFNAYATRNGPYRTKKFIRNSSGTYTATFDIAGIVDGISNAPAATNGNYYIDVMVYDIAGNWASKPKNSILYDTYAPTAGSVQINSNAKYTRTPSVTLTLSATDALSGVAQMAISNTETIGTYETYATSKSWTLTTGDGLKTVYVVFKDAAGNATVSF